MLQAQLEVVAESHEPPIQVGLKDHIYSPKGSRTLNHMSPVGPGPCLVGPEPAMEVPMTPRAVLPSE